MHYQTLLTNTHTLSQNGLKDLFCQLTSTNLDITIETNADRTTLRHQNTQMSSSARQYTFDDHTTFYLCIEPTRAHIYLYETETQYLDLSEGELERLLDDWQLETDALLMLTHLEHNNCLDCDSQVVLNAQGLLMQLKVLQKL